jgi:hypothetical protein
MKIRHGFVSNSSTSSFVILGYDISKNNEALQKVHDFANGTPDDNCWELTEALIKELKIKNIVFRNGGGEMGLGEDEEVLGILLAEVSSDGGGEDDDGRFSIPELQKDLDIIKERFGIEEELCIFKGTRMS